ncbi:hypothetical protein Unana1_08154 [Umbelopsis nana]
MAEDFLDDMEPSPQFLPGAGQPSQTMADFEAQLQAAMLQTQQQGMQPQAMNMINVDQLMSSTDLFSFDDFAAFNSPVQKDMDQVPSVLENSYPRFNPNVKLETASAVSSPSYDTLSDQQTSSMSPQNQQASMSAPAMNIPASTPKPVAAVPSVTIFQPEFASPTAYDNPTTAQSSTPPEKPEKKVAHNAIERRYRNNINDRIAELKSVVPALVHAKVKTGVKRNQPNDEEEDDDDDAEVLDGVAVATKLNKATILRKATEYIVHLKRVSQQTKLDNAALRQIIAQLPGGQDALVRHQLQNQQRVHQDASRLAFERSQQKQPMENDNQRKRQKAYNRRSQDDSDSSGPVTPPNSASGRIFMAAFMAVSLFATSPLTTGTVQRTADEHHHTSKAPASNANATDKPSDTSFSMLSALTIWNWLRAFILVAGITYLLLPYLRSSSGMQNRRRLRRSKRLSRLSFHSSQKASQVEMYEALAMSLDSPPPSSTSIFGAFFALILEIVRFVVRRMLNQDILYDGHLDEDQEWTRACTWLRMSELECVGGNPLVTRVSMLHSCLKTINLIEALETNNFRSYSRAYATAAVQMALAAPRFVSSFCTHHFWQLAYDFYDVDDFDQDTFDIFFSDTQQGDSEESVLSLLESDVWNEALNVMRLQTRLFHEDRIVAMIKPTSTVPLEIVANFHILRKLQPLLAQLVLLVTNPNDQDVRDDVSDLSDTRFDEILAACLSSNPARWYSLVGACVEAIWSNNIELAESLVIDIKDLPKDGSAEDQRIQRGIAYSLIACIQMRNGDNTAAFRVLLKARSVQMEHYKLNDFAEEGDILTIANNVIMLADFVVRILTLQTWIKLLETQESIKNGDKVVMTVPEIHAIVLSMIKILRRMTIAPPMVQDSYNQEMLDRLCRVSQIFYGSTDADSGCEFSDDDDYPSSQKSSTAARALRILQGLC